MSEGERMRTIRSILLHGLAAAVGSTLFGLAFCGPRVLDHHDRDFQLVLLGMCAGLLLGTVRFCTLSQYAIGTVLVWVIHLLVAQSTTWPYWVRDATYVLGLSLAVLGSQLVLVRSGADTSRMKRSLLRVGALLVGYLAAYVSLSLAWDVRQLAARLPEHSQMGLLLAVGSVLGVEFGEAIVGRRRMGVA